MKKRVDERLVQHSAETLRHLASLGNEGIPGFDWSAIESSHDLKTNSAKYLGKDIPEAFSDAYGVKLHKSLLKNIKGVEVREIVPGDIIPLRISSINRKGVIFEQSEAIKDNITCAVNLYQYPKFRDWLPSKPIDFKVIDKTNGTIKVDPFAGMFDVWIDKHTSHPEDQYHLKQDRSILVEDLKLVRGGFIGRTRIDTISNFCGRDVHIPVFIPGSQIVLNIEYDFSQWEGRNVRAFISNCVVRPNSDYVTLVCSTKQYLRHQGNLQMMQWFDDWCLGNEEWKATSNTEIEGTITGVCHTSSKCGVFVELPQHITAMVPCEPSELSKFKRGSNIYVKIDKFEEPTKWNGIQNVHIKPYVIENDILKNFNLRLILKLA